MQADKTTEHFLSDNSELWELITKNQIEAALASPPPSLPAKQKKGATTAKENSADDGKAPVFQKILRELFTSGQSAELEAQPFALLDTGSGTLFRNLTRLLFAVALNGQHPEIEKLLAKKLLQATHAISAEVKEKSNDYPRNTINAAVWMNGASMRAAFSYLSYYYQKTGQLHEQYQVEFMYARITLSIMGHYKTEVGPAMLSIAKLEEQLGKADTALRRYQAVISDFKSDATLFLEDKAEIPDDDATAILNSLLTACQAADRIAKTTLHETLISDIENILRRRK